MLEPCVFTDELSFDVEEALRICVAEDVRNVQLRQIQASGRNIVDLPDDEIRLIKALLDRHGMRVAGIGSPFGKCALTLDAYSDHLRLFDHIVRLAHTLDTRLVRVFAFYPARETDRVDRSDQLRANLPEIAERLRGPAERARQEGLTLALENEYTTLAGSCQDVRMVVDAVDSPALRVCWDVASGWYTGEPVLPDGYDQVRGFLRDVHVRDATRNPIDPSRHGEVCRLGDGVIDWSGVFRLLNADGYDGYCTLETHLYQNDPLGASKLPAATVHGMRELRRLIEGAHA